MACEGKKAMSVAHLWCWVVNECARREKLAPSSAQTEVNADHTDTRSLTVTPQVVASRAHNAVFGRQHARKSACWPLPAAPNRPFFCFVFAYSFIFVT